jgi:phosphoribosyl-AMP cyclohydrolase
MSVFDDIAFDRKGLVPVVTQDCKTHRVLMQAYAKKEQLIKTLETGKACYFSRSRNREWIKGETSGNYQNIVKVMVDCDFDCILYMVEQQGVACHTGEYSCFYRTLTKEGELVNE